MSTYNGERFIGEQIESIRSQTFRDWTLLIRDDGSTDATLKIVRDAMASDPRIALLQDSHGNVGPWRSFGLLLRAACEGGWSYIFFSDQDDVWLKSKMATQIDLLRAEEASRGRAPVLVHSDLIVVDSALRQIHPSFSEYQHMAYDPADPLGTLLIHNTVVGCTIAINAALASLADPLPADSPHDWWLALCAASAGRIASIKGSLVLYRQHAGNTIGARTRRSSLWGFLRTPFRMAKSVFGGMRASATQVRSLERRLGERVPGAECIQRPRLYLRAFERSASPMTRLRSLRASGVRTRRRVSRLVFPALVAAYPIYKGRAKA